MTRAGVIILDVDGVILDERPYWDVAMTVALREYGVDIGDASSENALFQIAFSELRMQRLCKRRGCNSNWDLAAALTASLDDETARGLSQARTTDERRAALTAWSKRVEELWNKHHEGNGQSRSNSGDPIMGFGIDREGPLLDQCAKRFQEKLATLDHDFMNDGAPCSPCEPAADIRIAIERFVNAGYDVRIFTGRTIGETTVPLQQLNLTDLIPTEGIIGYDQIAESQRQLNRTGLGKPHWFGAALATLGPDIAADLLNGSAAPSIDGRCVYVGDGMADFLTIESSRTVGLEIEYVHVRSGITDENEESRIIASPQTVAIVNKLSCAPDVLGISP